MKLRLRVTRKMLGKTQAQVAKEALISTTQYQNIEYGISEPSVRTAIRIADVLGVTSYQNFKKIFTQRKDSP